LSLRPVLARSALSRLLDCCAVEGLSRRRALPIAGACAAAVGVAAGVLALPGCSDDPPRRRRSAPISTPPPPDRPSAASRRGQAPFVWPLYGFDKQRTRAFLRAKAPHPPFRKVWSFRGAALLEFPPVIAMGRVVQLADNGVLNAIAKNSGRVLWRRKLGTLAASTPAVEGGTAYVSLLRRNRRTGGGRIVAVSLKNGRIRWSRPLPSRSESSPLLHRGRLYVGSESGAVLCLNARNGRVRWRYQAAGAVKSSPAFARGLLFFGDYGGQVQAVRARNGKLVWRARPPGAGTFYATAAVAFGRVFVGSMGGRQYAFSRATGRRRLGTCPSRGGPSASSSATWSARPRSESASIPRRSATSWTGTTAAFARRSNVTAARSRSSSATR
jgi:outer membrane protein assembly factor BamB